MERKNSQQSQHGKPESSAASAVNMQLECDPNLLELIGDTEICVKIADLGNACYNVSKIVGARTPSKSIKLHNFDIKSNNEIIIT